MRRYRVTYRFYAMLALLMVVVFSVSFLVARGRLRDASRKLAEKKVIRTEVADAVAALEEAFAYSQTDAYVERVARDELGLIYPGEYRYVGDR